MYIVFVLCVSCSSYSSSQVVVAFFNYTVTVFNQKYIKIPKRKGKKIMPLIKKIERLSGD